LRQVDVAKRADVSASVVARIERGRLLDVSLRSLLAVCDVLDIRLDFAARWRGGDLDRMLNANHAALAESTAAFFLDRPGWELRAELSFNIAGERGVVDFAAWHAATRTILMIELKTDIVDVGETIGTFDRKRRLAGRIAASLGWRAEHAASALIVRDTRTNHRRIEQHGLVFRSSLPDDGRRFRAWLMAPIGQLAALAFLPDHHSLATGRSAASVRRVRVRKQPSRPVNLPTVRAWLELLQPPKRQQAAIWQPHRVIPRIGVATR
jgi:transcriptional regulator with XRE-family HTH domain